MAKAGEIPCLLGNGICPATCANYEAAKRIHESGADADMTDSDRRMAVVFGDITHGVNVFDIADAMAGCALEAPPVESG